MSSATNANAVPTQERELSAPAAVLSFLIPGLGQIYQGRYGKGLLFMVALLGMFFLGQAMGQWQNVYLPKPEQGNRGIVNSLMNRWHYAGQFWIGVAAWPAIWQFLDQPMPDKDAHPLLNIYQKAPNETELNKFLINSDKSPDLGWVYTVIAGMLNILVIYDAWAGPAFLPLAKPTPKPLVSVAAQGGTP